MYTLIWNDIDGLYCYETTSLSTLLKEMNNQGVTWDAINDKEYITLYNGSKFDIRNRAELRLPDPKAIWIKI